MKRMTCFICLALFCCQSMSVFAQMEDLGQSLVKGLGKLGAKKKAEMDYVDFQFAISVNENAGFFDVEQRGEALARGLYSLKDAQDKTPAENARDSLEFGISLYDARMYSMAEGYFEQARNIAEKNNLQEDIVYLRILSSQALVSLTQGKTIEAEQLLTDVLDRTMTAQGKASAAYVANFNNIAKLDQNLGRYNEAEKKFDEIVQLTVEVFGKASMQNAIVLNNKAMLFQSMGRYDQAIALMKQAIAVSEEALKKPLQGSKSFDSRKFQLNLAYLYQQAGRYAEAESTFLAIKKIFDNRLQTSNLEYASLLNQMGILFIQMGKKTEVEEYLKKSSAIYLSKVGEENAYYAKSIADLGNFYRTEGRYQEAEPLITKALDIRLRTLGTNHPDIARSREDVAILKWKTGNWEEAYASYKQSMDMTLDFIDHYFPPMSEAEKTKYWDIIFPRFQRFYNFALEAVATNPSITAAMFDYRTATKALLLNNTNKVKQAILSSGNQGLINDYLTWIGQKESLARFYALTKEELKNQHINLDSMEQAANRMERSLSERSTEFSSGYAVQRITSSQIRQVLTDQEAVVEVIRLQGFDQHFTENVRYAVLVLTKADALPKLTVIEDGTQLETRYLRYYRNAIQQRITDEISYDQFWAPIEKQLAGKRSIYLSPDGVYNQVNLNTLRKKDGSYFLSINNLVILGNSKDLIAIKSRKATTPAKTAALLGFPDYGNDELSPLPGTKAEIDGVTAVLKTAGYRMSSFLEKNATEANIKALKRPEIVHIATHGYFLEDLGMTAPGFGVQAENASHNPLLRSGLMLAGAGLTMSGQQTPNLESNDNGILTAYEAMNLDLDGTELVILSACETGLGDVKSGEGVYGLQRAFQVAGARALIMSLWKVDDAATQALMTSFYTNWVRLRDKEKAFKQAQVQLMTKYKDPYYWGAFVMMGK